MKKKELFEKIEEQSELYKKEVYRKDSYFLICYAIRINDLITLRNIRSIRVSENESLNKTIVWFDNNSMDIEDLEKIHIMKTD